MLWIVSKTKDEFSELFSGLTSNGYSFIFYNRISEALNELNNDIPEAIFVNANQNEISCFEFCHRVKTSSLFKKIKLFVLSNNTDESMEVEAFNSGADEFVNLPLKQKAFLKRISARLDSSVSSISIIHRSKGKASLQIDRESFSVYLDQNLVQLSQKEFELLHLIASRPGKVFTREEIFNKIWKRNYLSKERTIDVHILRLRKKLGDDFILTQKGIGYRFCA